MIDREEDGKRERGREAREGEREGDEERATHSPIDEGSITRWLMSSLSCERLASSPVHKKDIRPVTKNTIVFAHQSFLAVPRCSSLRREGHTAQSADQNYLETVLFYFS